MVKLHMKATYCHSYGHFTYNLILRIMLQSSYFIDDEIEARSDFSKIIPLASGEGRTNFGFRTPYSSFPLHQGAVPSTCFYINIGLNLSQYSCRIFLKWFIYINIQTFYILVRHCWSLEMRFVLNECTSRIFLNQPSIVCLHTFHQFQSHVPENIVLLSVVSHFGNAHYKLLKSLVHKNCVKII